MTGKNKTRGCQEHSTQMRCVCVCMRVFVCGWKETSVSTDRAPPLLFMAYCTPCSAFSLQPVNRTMVQRSDSVCVCVCVCVLTHVQKLYIKKTVVLWYLLFSISWHFDKSPDFQINFKIAIDFLSMRSFTFFFTIKTNVLKKKQKQHF